MNADPPATSPRASGPPPARGHLGPDLARVEQLDRDRRRIAAELYDGPAQLLGYALLRLDELGGQPGDAAVTGFPGGSTGALADVRGAVEAALSEISSIAGRLRTPELSTLCLADVVQRALRDSRRTRAIDVAVEAAGLECEAPLSSRIVAYHIVRDAIPLLHAEGGDVSVRLRARRRGSTFSLTVAGTALPPSVLPDATARLRYHAAWAELLGGSCVVAQRRVRGSRGVATVTDVRALLPL